ncbi:MAG: site-specific integrase [Planctomycetes bacterium]|nr:site-specific integrase [Planctomycetota bacterium]
MASLINDPNGQKRIAFNIGQDRRAIRLGRCADRDAERFLARVEDLIKAVELNDAPDARTAAWLSGLPDATHAKLARVGLCVQRGLQRPTLERLLAAFFDALEVKPGTRTTYTQAKAGLESHFGADRLLASISTLDAERWRQSLRDEELAEATIAKRIKTARQVFRAGVKWGMLASNPFDGVKAGAMTNRERMHFVALDVAEKVLSACPNHEWRLIFALSRYAGLRCPSEHLALRWTDVLWDQSKIIVRSTKTEGHAGRELRHVPIFPELLPYLRESFEKAEEGAEFLIARYRVQNANLRTQLERIIERAGVKPWPRLFHNLRASRQTELTERFPAHVVCSWMGNTEAVAMGHYLKVRETDFARAATEPTNARAAQIPARTGAESSGPERTTPKAEFAEVHSRQADALCVASGANGQVTPMGFEPMFLP